MCKAYDAGITKNALEGWVFQEDDTISSSRVAVYQFNDEGAYSAVQEVRYKDGMFDVPTFKDSLLDILSMTTDIQDYQG